jgi:hypothetical protein
MVEGDHTFASVTDKISDVTLKKRTPFHWFIGFAIAFLTDPFGTYIELTEGMDNPKPPSK